jgi:hypothetical protein
VNVIIRIEGKLLWKYGRTKQGNYIAVCGPIAQTVQADKFSDLLETINEALDSTFRELLSSGHLEQFLRDRGWSSQLPAPTERKNLRFDMPFELKGVRRHDFNEAVC